ncbi:MAG: cell division protein FtsL [Bacilli bacterium]|jgi:cell division protein FtsL|nr:cell division protein FtsL [Bacilli bacterium]
MRTKKVKRVKLLKGEKFMFFLVVLFGFVIMPASWVYTKALLSETNIELEKVRTKINRQNNTNEALGMQIDELASIDNIQNIASENGLSYNNSNIKTIND